MFEMNVCAGGTRAICAEGTKGKMYGTLGTCDDGSHVLHLVGNSSHPNGMTIPLPLSSFPTWKNALPLPSFPTWENLFAFTLISSFPTWEHAHDLYDLHDLDGKRRRGALECVPTTTTVSRASDIPTGASRYSEWVSES